MDPTPPGRQPTLIDPSRALTDRLPVPSRGAALIAGRYALRDRIGSGGMCEVWRAHDTTLDRPVAMKLLHTHLADDADARARFAVEAKRAAAISHPRVVRVFDAGEDPGAGAGTGQAEAWIAMELIDGPSLADRLGEGPLPVADALRVGVEVAQGLGAAHALGVVHRDVKPANILLGPDGARLSDFGIARAAGEARVTATGQMVGTAAYLAPEQARGEPATPASDVYALGCVLFEVLTGRPRFTGEGPLQTALARVDASTTVHDLGEQVPQPVARAVVDLLAPDPADRPADGAAAADRLRAAGDGERPQAVAEPLAATMALPRAGLQTAPDAPTTGPAEPHTSAGPLRDASAGRRRPGLVAGLFIGLIALAGLLALQAGEEGGDGTAPAVAQEPASATLGAQLTSFDPQGGGQEHEDEVALLTDGDPTTAWTTERYSSAAFGNLKDGVGVLLDLGEPVEVGEVRLLGLTPGQTVQLRVAESEPSGVEGTTVVAEAAGAADQLSLTPDGPITARWLVVWLTGELPAAGGGHRGSIGEIEVLGS